MATLLEISAVKITAEILFFGRVWGTEKREHFMSHNDWYTTWEMVSRGYGVPRFTAHSVRKCALWDILAVLVFIWIFNALVFFNIGNTSVNALNFFDDCCF
jgi:hypothetical protein